MRKVVSIIFKVIGWIFVIAAILSFIAWIVVPLIYDNNEYTMRGSIFGTLLTFAIGYAIRELGYRLGKTQNNTATSIVHEEQQKAVTISSTNKRHKTKIQWKKLLFSILLFGLFAFCVGSVDEGDSITGYMIVFYVPLFIVLYIYYVRLIWKYGSKITKEQVLILPLLQKIKLFLNYDCEKEADRNQLFSTSFWGLILSILCTAIVSTMYYDMGHGGYHSNGIRDYYGICYLLLSLPITVWIICLSRVLFRDWLTISIKIKNKESDNG